MPWPLYSFSSLWVLSCPVHRRPERDDHEPADRDRAAELPGWPARGRRRCCCCAHLSLIPPECGVSAMETRFRAEVDYLRAVGQERSPIDERFPRPSVMGVVNVTPDSFSDGGVNFEPATRSPRAGACSRRAPRSSTSAASRPARAPTLSRSTRSCAASCPCWRSSRGEVPRLDRHCEGRGRAARARARRRARERRHRAARRSRAGRGRRRRRARTSVSCTCTASRGRCRSSPTLRRRRRRRRGVPRGAARGSRSTPGSRRSASASTPGFGFGKTVEQNFELLAGCGELAALGRPVAGRLLAQVLARPHPRRPGRDDRPALREPRAPRSPPSSAARPILRVHDVREHVEALTVAAAVA